MVHVTIDAGNLAAPTIKLRTAGVTLIELGGITTTVTPGQARQIAEAWDSLARELRSRNETQAAR